MLLMKETWRDQEGPGGDWAAGQLQMAISGSANVFYVMWVIFSWTTAPLRAQERRPVRASWRGSGRQEAPQRMAGSEETSVFGSHPPLLARACSCKLDQQIEPQVMEECTYK